MLCIPVHSSQRTEGRGIIMSILKRTLGVIAFIAFIVLSLSGCGTVKKMTETKTTASNSEIVSKAPKTTIAVSQIRITPETICGMNDPVSPNSVIEVYCGFPFSAQTLVGSTIATDEGTGLGTSFTVPIADLAYDTFYVVATAQGLSMSDPVTLIK